MSRRLVNFFAAFFGAIVVPQLVGHAGARDDRLVVDCKYADAKWADQADGRDT